MENLVYIFSFMKDRMGSSVMEYYFNQLDLWNWSDELIMVFFVTSKITQNVQFITRHVCLSTDSRIILNTHVFFTKNECATRSRFIQNDSWING